MAFRVFVAFEKKTQIGELWRNFCTIGNRGATMSLVSASLLQLPPPFISLFLSLPFCLHRENVSLLPFGLEREEEGGKKVAFIFIAFESWRRVKFGGGRHRTLWLANEKKPSLILLVLLYKGGNAIQCYIGTRPSRALSRFHTVSASRSDLSHRGTFRSNRELFETVLRRERRAIRSLFPF